MTNTNRPSCVRPGCRRRIPANSMHETCSPTCTTLVRIVTENQRIHQLIGPGSTSTELAEAERDLLDAYADLTAIRDDIRREAIAAGITAAAWSAIVRGKHTVRTTPTGRPDGKPE